MFPLVSHVEWSVATDLAIALVLGLGFGFCPERAGFCRAVSVSRTFAASCRRGTRDQIIRYQSSIINYALALYLAQ